ncbi:MAG: hypothetical protein JW862_01410 [Anaerolineales bacterium]|nr:hypothetical protein [Anaerolineales bacterium]
MDKKRISAAVVLLSILLLALTACGSGGKSVDRLYWDYWQACQESKYGTAREMLTETALEKSDQVGVCGFTHDYINIIELARNGPQHTFNEDPEIIVDEDSARMMWIDDQGTITIILFYQVDGTWKVEDIIWSL